MLWIMTNKIQVFTLLILTLFIALYFSFPSKESDSDIIYKAAKNEHLAILSNDTIKGIVVVAHGLNAKPHSMDSIILELLKMNLKSYLVKLSGHYSESQPIDSIDFNQWPSEFLHVYSNAKYNADSLNVPLYFLGYSLGALIGQYVISHSNGANSFSKQVLLAPATATKNRTSFVKAIFIFPENWKLPSYTPEPYRANEKLPIKAYKFLFQYQDSIAKNDLTKLNIPTLAFIDPDDELISTNKLKKFSISNELDSFRIVELNSNMDDRDYGYHHLIIDKKSMGEENWNLFVSECQSFFTK